MTDEECEGNSYKQFSECVNGSTPAAYFKYYIKQWIIDNED